MWLFKEGPLEGATPDIISTVVTCYTMQALEWLMVAQKLAVGNKTVAMSSSQKRRITQKVEHLVNVLPPADVVVVRVLANRTISKYEAQ